MIKKITLTAFLSLFIGISLQAQSLVNTAWTTNLQGTSINVRFTATTVDIAQTGSPYDSVATYTESGSTFSVTDIDPVSCGTDVGVYAISYTGNTMSLAITTEPCTARGDFFANGPFTQTNISVFEAAKFATTKLYPNPANNVINLDINEGFDEEVYLIYSIQGQIVSAGTLHSGENSISIAGLKSGLYQIKLKDNATATLKFVKL
jgi:hypothetical protein